MNPPVQMFRVEPLALQDASRDLGIVPVVAVDHHFAAFIEDAVELVPEKRRQRNVGCPLDVALAVMDRHPDIDQARRLARIDDLFQFIHAHKNLSWYRNQKVELFYYIAKNQTMETPRIGVGE